MTIDYCWTDGYSEIVCNTRAEALNIREMRGQGKVWRRVFDGPYLERVTDVTEQDVKDNNHV